MQNATTNKTVYFIFHIQVNFLLSLRWIDLTKKKKKKEKEKTQRLWIKGECLTINLRFSFFTCKCWETLIELFWWKYSNGMPKYQNIAIFIQDLFHFWNNPKSIDPSSKTDLRLQRRIYTFEIVWEEKKNLIVELNRVIMEGKTFIL